MTEGLLFPKSKRPWQYLVLAVVVALLCALMSCKNSQKSVSKSQSETELETRKDSSVETHQVAFKTDLSESRTETQEEQQTTFEVRGPAEIRPDGTITLLDSSSSFSGSRRKQSTAETTEKQSSTDTTVADQRVGVFTDTSTKAEIRSEQKEVKRKLPSGVWIGIFVFVVGLALVVTKYFRLW